MLILARRVGEEIIIDGNIRVSVVALSSNQVRLGISAPDWMKIDRLEVHQRRNEIPLQEQGAEIVTS